MRIREATVDDVPGLDLIRQAVEPWHVASVETQRVWFESNPPESRVHRVGAVENDRLIGYGWAKLDLYAPEPGTAILNVVVHPDTRLRGIGSAILEQLEAHLRSLGANLVCAHLMDEPHSTDFAAKRGYELGATNRWIVLDPRELPPLPPMPDGVTVVTARESGPQPFYDVIDIAARDEPGDVPFTGMPYQDWLDQYWPTIDVDLSMIAFVDGMPAAITSLNANYATNKAMSAGTDCLPQYRGRKLVKLIKSISLRTAAEAGITAAYTGNDEINAPMRAVNAWLGYQLVGASRTSLKKL